MTFRAWWWVLGALAMALPAASAAESSDPTPCLNGSDCAPGFLCVHTLCSTPQEARAAPPPPYGIAVFADEEECPGALKIGVQWRDQMTALMRANHIDIHWHKHQPLEAKDQDPLGAISEGLLARRRATLRILVGCSPESAGYDIRFEVFDLSRLNLRSEFEYATTVTHLELTPYLKAMEVFANSLLTLDGAPPGILGSRIAFVCRLPGNIKEVYSLDMRGVDLRRETHYENLTLLPAWTGDLKVAATTWLWKNPDIFLDGKPFLTRPGLNTGIDFHPGSRRFLVASGDMEAQDIFLGDTETGTILRRLTHDPGIDTAPSFSPSGESFVFVSDRLGSPQIFVMKTGEKRPHRISWAGAYNSAPAWSPDGRSIAWSRRRGGTRNQIMIADVESPRSSARVLLRGAASFETPSFSPDGRYVVAARRERHDSYPVLYNIRTERLMPLARVELPGPCHQPTWSGVPR